MSEATTSTRPQKKPDPAPPAAQTAIAAATTAVASERIANRARAAYNGLWEINPNHVSIYGYRTDHSWEQIFAENYFLSLAHIFCETIRGKKYWKPDEIRIYRKITVEGGASESHYYEFATVVVTFADEKRVTIQPISPVIVIGADVPPSFPPAAETER